MLGPGLEAERSFERHDLGCAGPAAVRPRVFPASYELMNESAGTVRSFIICIPPDDAWRRSGPIFMECRPPGLDP